MDQCATVLFVDDEERILRSLSMLFRSQYHVITATSAAAALEHVERERIHVIVSDQRMPGMLGVELLRRVREVSPTTMRILLTGYADLTAIVGSINEGEIFRFINKPWNPAEVKETVRKAAEIASVSDAIDRTLDPASSSDEPAWPAMLVIDESADLYDTVSEVVGGRGQVLWGSDIERTFDLLGSHEIGLVVSETRIGDTDVTPVIKAIKRHRPDILAIVVTSFEDTSTIIELINEGQVYRFLPKPVRRGLLDLSLRSALRQYASLRRRPQLLQRYTVEKPAHDPEPRLSERIMGCIRKMRAQHHSLSGA